MQKITQLGTVIQVTILRLSSISTHRHMLSCYYEQGLVARSQSFGISYRIMILSSELTYVSCCVPNDCNVAKLYISTYQD